MQGSPFSPISPQERDISNLFIGILIAGAVVFALVAGLVLFIAVRYRHRGGSDEPYQEFGRRRLEIAWTIAPAVVLAVILGFTVTTMAATSPGPGDHPPDLIITGYQWWWGIQYPASGVVTANEIHLPVGKRMLLQLDSADVIHDFWVPQLGRKMDMIPGHTNWLWVEPTQTGTFLGACAEYLRRGARLDAHPRHRPAAGGVRRLAAAAGPAARRSHRRRRGAGGATLRAADLRQLPRRRRDERRPPASARTSPISAAATRSARACWTTRRTTSPNG